MTTKEKDKANASPIGCVIAMWLVVAVNVWWLLGGWPVSDWIDSFGKRHPILFATLPAAYGGYLIRSSLASRRKYGRTEYDASEMRWGIGMAVVAAIIVVTQATKWLLVK